MAWRSSPRSRRICIQHLVAVALVLCIALPVVPSAASAKKRHPDPPIQVSSRQPRGEMVTPNSAATYHIKVILNLVGTEIFQATTKYLLQRYPSVYAFEVWNEPDQGRSGGVLKKLKMGGKPGGNVKRGWRNYRRTWESVSDLLGGDMPGGWVGNVGAGTMAQVGSDRTVGMSRGMLRQLGSRNPVQRMLAQQALIHEFAHTRQNWSALPANVAEQGAEAFSRRLAKRRLGLTGRQLRAGSSYSGAAKRGFARGLDWVMRGQFAGGAQGGVLAKLQSGGGVPRPTRSSHWAKVLANASPGGRRRCRRYASGLTAAKGRSSSQSATRTTSS